MRRALLSVLSLAFVACSARPLPWPSAVDPQAPPDLARRVDMVSSGEPFDELRQIFSRTTAWWAAHGHQLPGRTYGFNPAQGTCCAEPNQVCGPEPDIWTSNHPWDQIGFAPAGYFHYSYEFTPAADGRSFQIDASADLNCDGIFSVYRLVGTLNASGGFDGIDRVTITNPGE